MGTLSFCSMGFLPLPTKKPRMGDAGQTVGAILPVAETAVKKDFPGNC